MINSNPTRIAAAAALAGCLAAGPASAMLVLQSATPIGGSGLGAVSTVLTLQSPGTTTSEQGSVFWNGSANQTSGNAQAQNSTYTFSQLGITSASQIGIVFNASEPGNDAAVNLASLTLSIYNPAGSPVFSSGTVSCPGNPTCSLTNTFSGTGNSGFLFALDATQAAQANSFVIGTNRLALAATVLNATGGIETFFVTNLGGATPVTPIPEPETYALMLAGLGLVAFVARRRKLS